MNKFLWTIVMIGGLLMTGCGNQIPSDIIQPDKMEEVLYDYHLSTSMATELNSEDNYKKISYRNYVFQKHQITEAEFDSSMVWYTRNTGKLSEIYLNLNERFNKQKNQLKMVLDARQDTEYVSQPGDTIDVWHYGNLYWMGKAALNNQLTFEILPDSNFHQKDAFLWKANFEFLTSGTATMGMNVMFDNDSLIGESCSITQSGEGSLYLHTDSAYQIKSINGFIYISGDSLQSPQVLVHDLSLTRYHFKADSTDNQELVQVTDSIQ